MIAIQCDFTAEFIGHIKVNNSGVEWQWYFDSFVVWKVRSGMKCVLKHSLGGQDGMVSGPPKVPRQAQYDKLRVEGGAAVTLLCEAQAHPIPTSRLVAGMSREGVLTGKGKYPPSLSLTIRASLEQKH